MSLALGGRGLFSLELLAQVDQLGALVGQLLLPRIQVRLVCGERFQRLAQLVVERLFFRSPRLERGVEGFAIENIQVGRHRTNIDSDCGSGALHTTSLASRCAARRS